MSDLLSLELRGVESSNKADCKRTCESDIDCYAIVSYSSNNCLLLKTKEGNGQEVNIAIRQCISGEVKQESDVITPTPVKDQNVVLDCSNTAKNPIASASLSYVYLPISCYNYSTVENVTIVESTTVTQNVTITDEVTQSVEVTLTVNFTMTENVNITDYVIVKENVTRTENVTVTQYIERTEYVTENAVTAIVTSFAPYTVTVQVPITPLPSACEDQTSYINTSNTRYIEEAVQNISKALYMDKKTTNSYIRTKTSAQDNRPSSVTMGYVGIVCVVVPLVLILLSDLKTIYVHMSAVCRSYNGPPSPPA
ncbi:uncharacterized protein LOC134230868 [Saccostrea cucullata]|uniref:uncharacterized protein LOC134230868 n=1 Tax=Saccostrea cuccullata TaxID=36930 RepID=UPI002ED5BCB1